MRIGPTRTAQTMDEEDDWRRAWRKSEGRTHAQERGRPILQPYNPNISRPQLQPSDNLDTVTTETRDRQHHTQIITHQPRSMLPPPIAPPRPLAPPYSPSWPTWVTSPSSRSRPSDVVRSLRQPDQADVHPYTSGTLKSFQPSYDFHSSVLQNLHEQPVHATPPSQQPGAADVEDEQRSCKPYTRDRLQRIALPSARKSYFPHGYTPRPANRVALDPSPRSQRSVLGPRHIPNRPLLDSPVNNRLSLLALSTSSRDTGSRFELGSQRVGDQVPPDRYTPRSQEMTRAELETAMEFSFARPPPLHTPHAEILPSFSVSCNDGMTMQRSPPRSSVVVPETPHLPIDDLDDLMLEVDRYIKPSPDRHRPVPRLPARSSADAADHTPRHVARAQATTHVGINVTTPAAFRVARPTDPTDPQLTTPSYSQTLLPLLPTAPPLSQPRSLRSIPASLRSSSNSPPEELQVREIEKFGTTKQEWGRMWREASNAL